MSDTLELITTKEGVLLPVRGCPGSRAAELRGLHQGRLRVAVTAVAERGKANQAIVQLVAKALGLRKSQVSLAGGLTQPEKQLLITGLDADELRERVARALAE